MKRKPQPTEPGRELRTNSKNNVMHRVMCPSADCTFMARGKSLRGAWCPVCAQAQLVDVGYDS